ncbi:MAG: Gfo/Idh/MocA family oxidoreductase [Candidatus Ratteibacteria bacterium]
MPAKKIRVGVFGGKRGATMVSTLSQHPEAEMVAVCDRYQPHLKRCELLAKSHGIKLSCYKSFDRFFAHDMDAVILANNATEHVPFAVRILDSGRHVCSEVLACQTLAEAVSLAEAVERSRKIYSYAENYCYFRGTMEMRRRFRKGDIGTLLHAEGEYVHDCESIWPSITYGERNHWRNWVHSTFYCSHSIGPILTITGARPIRVSAYETPNVNSQRYGKRGSDGSVIVCQLDNGATMKVLPSAGFKRKPGSVWYAVYGSKGMMETDRWGETFNRLNVFIENAPDSLYQTSYVPKFPFETDLSRLVGGHGGSDFYTMHFFLSAIKGKEEGKYAIDVYQALDMTLPGTLGYCSILGGNIPFEVPDMRNKKEREKYRNDTWSLDPKGPDGGKTPSSSFGSVEIADSFYTKQALEYRQKMKNG